MRRRGTQSDFKMLQAVRCLCVFEPADWWVSVYAFCLCHKGTEDFVLFCCSVHISADMLKSLFLGLYLLLYKQNFRSADCFPKLARQMSLSIRHLTSKVMHLSARICFHTRSHNFICVYIFRLLGFFCCCCCFSSLAVSSIHTLPHFLAGPYTLLWFVFLTVQHCLKKNGGGAQGFNGSGWFVSSIHWNIHLRVSWGCEIVVLPRLIFQACKIQP